MTLIQPLSIANCCRVQIISVLRECVLVLGAVVSVGSCRQYPGSPYGISYGAPTVAFLYVGEIPWSSRKSKAYLGNVQSNSRSAFLTHALFSNSRRSLKGLLGKQRRR